MLLINIDSKFVITFYWWKSLWMLYNILLQEGARSKVPQGYSLTRRSSSDCNSIANRAIWLWRWGVFMAMFLCSTLLQMTYFAVHNWFYIWAGLRPIIWGYFLRWSTIAKQQCGVSNASLKPLRDNILEMHNVKSKMYVFLYFWYIMEYT